MTAPGIDARLDGLQQAKANWVLFDAADTLIYPKPDVANVYCTIAASFGLERDTERVKSRFRAYIAKHFHDHRSSEEVDHARWQALVLDVLETDNVEVFQELWEHFARPEAWCLFDDVAPAWQQLSRRGFQLAIASNFDARLLRIVQSFPPICGASHVFVSSLLGYRKPCRQFYQSIESTLNVDSAIMVGDNFDADVLGAEEAGWTAYHLNREQDQRDQHHRAESGLGAKREGQTIHRLTELSECI